MVKLDVLKFYRVPLILRLGLFLVCSSILAILSLDVLICCRLVLVIGMLGVLLQINHSPKERKILSECITRG